MTDTTTETTAPCETGTTAVVPPQEPYVPPSLGATRPAGQGRVARRDLHEQQVRRWCFGSGRSAAEAGADTRRRCVQGRARLVRGLYASLDRLTDDALCSA